MKNNPFGRYLPRIIPTIIVYAMLLVGVWVGVPFLLLLSALCIYHGVTFYRERKPAKMYLKAQLLLLGTVVIITWIYFYTGMYGFIGLFVGVLLVAGILVYRRRKLILELVRLWEKTFLGRTMEERLEQKKNGVKK